VGGQHHAPAALPPGKTRYPLYRRLGGPQGRSGRVRKISPVVVVVVVIKISVVCVKYVSLQQMREAVSRSFETVM
jgi:hypothetical protein